MGFSSLNGESSNTPIAIEKLSSIFICISKGSMDFQGLIAKPLSSIISPLMKYERASSLLFLKITCLVKVGLKRTLDSSNA